MALALLGGSDAARFVFRRCCVLLAFRSRCALLVDRVFSAPCALVLDLDPGGLLRDRALCFLGVRLRVVFPDRMWLGRVCGVCASPCVACSSRV